GVRILDTVTIPCKAWQTGEYEFHIILTQGLNRQIRRMSEALGYRVNDLIRTRIVHIKLGTLPEGSLRELTSREKAELDKHVME
ncbi:MAG TPA: 23S rRNA pseudouridine synthase F, partial [Clostridia bacterium]|nr:23S rRNA pseudouridine synthase F [Clostridia bacterium]